MPLKLAPIEFGDTAIFLRADRLEGVGDEYVEATGKVELRTRRDTVLADWLRYDFTQQEVWAKGDVVIRHGIDWISGPELRYKRDTETGFFSTPQFFVGETGGRGSAAELAFVGPDQYKITTARYTTCVAPTEDWYIRMGELDVDKAKMEGTGHDATLNFFGTPVAYTPWLDFPLSSDRKSGFLTPVIGSTGIRGFEYAQPYYFNLAPNYDATLIAHEMTKRGLQIGAQGRYLFENAQGEAEGAYLNDDRQTGTNRYALSWKHNQTFAEAPGFAAFWNLNKVSDNTYFSDLSANVGLTSQTTLPRQGGVSYTSGPWQVVAQAQAFQTLADPNVPPGPPPYNRVPQLYASLQETDWAGLTFSGHAEYADFRNPVLVEGQRAYAWPTVGFQRQGAGVVLQRAGRRARARLRARQRDARPHAPGLRDPDHVGRRGPHVRARLGSARREFHPDARAARVLRLRAVQGPERRADLRHRARRLQFLAALQPQSLPRQRPHRRREPADARAVVAAARSRHRSRAPAPRAWRAILSTRRSRWC